MDGFETLERLKTDERTRHIPVIMVTAIQTDPQSRTRGLTIGADAFLSKPIDEAELVAQVKVALRIKHAEDALRKEKESLESVVAERTAALQEKMKILGCLYEIARLIEIPGISLPEILKGTVDLLPPAMKHPSIACARLILDDQVFQTTNFKATGVCQTRPIHVHGIPVGMIEVGYPEEIPSGIHGPFFGEEDALLDTVSEQMGQVIQRMRLESELRSASIRLEALWSVTSLVEADTKSVADHILKSITKMTDSEYGFYGFINDDETVMTIHSWSGEAMENCLMVEKPCQFTIRDAGVWGEAVRRREPLILNDYTAEHPGKKGLPRGHVRLTKLLVVPFMVKDRITSVAAVANRATYYNQKDVAQLQAFLNSIQAIVSGKRMEESLAQKATLLAQTEAISHTGSWRHDLATGKVTWSDEMYAIFGLDRDLFNNDSEQAIDLAVHPEDRILLYAVNSAARKDGIPRPLDYRIIHPDGSIRWVHAQGEQEFDPDSGRVVALVGFVKDITERKHLEAERDRLITAIEQTPEAIVITDLQGNIEYVNPAYEIISGYTKNELLGQTPRIVKSGQHDASFYADLWKTISSGRDWKGRITNKRKDGSLYVEDTTITPVFNKSGKTTTFVAVKRDVTADVQMEDKLRQSQKMEAIGVLAGGIAHDFNNILFPIVGHSEMLLADTPEDSPFRESLDEIYISSLRAKELVRQILTFSRQEQNELQLMKMQPVVNEAMKMLRSTLPSTIKISYEGDASCGPVKADPTQVHQIIMNLVTNAYHAMEETGGEIKISLKEIELGEYDLTNVEMSPGLYVCLCVEDAGKGMDQDVISKIFDPFFTTKPTGKGTGLGLSVVHGIVTRMSGGIKVYSEVGVGTIIRVYFPVEKNTPIESKSPSHEPIRGGTEQILIVDDEAVIVSMEKQMLQRLGYQVTTRTSSVEALESFRENPDKFNLILTDMTMPNMTGVQLAREVIAIRPDIPIIVCTGFSDKIDEKIAKASGIRSMLMKPVARFDLAHAIRSVLDDE